MSLPGICKPRLPLSSPSGFIRAYELSGVPGEAAIRGVGVLFLMWNIPYLFALVDPVRYRLALILSLLMQLTGFIGETYIYLTLPAGHDLLGSSILRFIAFDGVGLVLLAIAYWIGCISRDRSEFSLFRLFTML